MSTEAIHDPKKVVVASISFPYLQTENPVRTDGTVQIIFYDCSMLSNIQPSSHVEVSFPCSVARAWCPRIQPAELDAAKVHFDISEKEPGERTLHVTFNFGEPFAEQRLKVPLKVGIHESMYGGFYQSSFGIDVPSSKALDERHSLSSDKGVPMKPTHYGWHRCDHHICHAQISV